MKVSSPHEFRQNVASYFVKDPSRPKPLNTFKVLVAEGTLQLFLRIKLQQLVSEVKEN